MALEHLGERRAALENQMLANCRQLEQFLQCPKGWQIFGNRLEPAILQNIVRPLQALNQVHNPNGNTFRLGQIPDLHSLIPYSLEARKPVFECTSADGLRGDHITKARESRDHFDPMADAIVNALASAP